MTWMFWRSDGDTAGASSAMRNEYIIRGQRGTLLRILRCWRCVEVGGVYIIQQSIGILWWGFTTYMQRNVHHVSKTFSTLSQPHRNVGLCDIRNKILARYLLATCDYDVHFVMSSSPQPWGIYPPPWGLRVKTFKYRRNKVMSKQCVSSTLGFNHKTVFSLIESLLTFIWRIQWLSIAA